MKIPLARPSFDEREVEAVREVLESGWVVQGPKVEAFEVALADLHHVAHTIAVSSGTAALHVAFLALALQPGDAVFVPSFAWPSAANVAHLMGARPVLVDVLPDTYNIDPADLERAVARVRAEGTHRPRLVVPVHQFGLPADMTAILAISRENGMDVVEDAACALGAADPRHDMPVGGIGRCGILSFHPRKAVTTGEGGAVLTNDEDLAKRCRIFRNHGQDPDRPHTFVEASTNYRLTDIQAAIGLVQLEKLPGILAARRGIAETYLRELAGTDGLRLPANRPEHTWQTFMVVVERGDRDAVVQELAANGIGSGIGSVSAHCIRFYAETYGYRFDDIPVSSELWEKGLALPVYEGIGEDGGRYAVKALAQAVSCVGGSRDRV